MQHSLRNGLIAYDRRKGWRGPIQNIRYSRDWPEKIDKKFSLEKSIDWQIAIVKKVNQFNSVIELMDNSKGIIEFKDISWTKKDFQDLFKQGDIIYVKKKEMIHIVYNKFQKLMVELL